MATLLSSFDAWSLNNASPQGDKTIVLNSSIATATSPPIMVSGQGVRKFVMTLRYHGPNIPHAGLRVGSIIIEKDGKQRSGSGGTDVAYWNPTITATATVPVTLTGSQIGFRMVIARPTDSPDRNGTVFCEDPLVVDAQDFTWEYRKKEAFVTDMISVSPWGLFTIRDEPVVPLGIMADRRRTLGEMRRLRAQGFNTNMWAASMKQARLAVEADMYFMLPLSPYLWHKGWAYKKWPQLASWYRSILDSGLGEYCLGFYFDNEAYREHTTIQKGVSIIRNDITDQYPIYSLNGNYGLAAKQAQMNWADCVGTYTSHENSGGAATGIDGVLSLYHDPHQTKPVTFAQRNGSPIGDDLLSIAGKYCTATSWWGDDRKRAETHTWWHGYPAFAAEFQDRVFVETLDDDDEPPVGGEETPPPISDEDLFTELSELAKPGQTIRLGTLGSFDVMLKKRS